MFFSYIQLQNFEITNQIAEAQIASQGKAISARNVFPRSTQHYGQPSIPPTKGAFLIQIGLLFVQNNPANKTVMIYSILLLALNSIHQRRLLFVREIFCKISSSDDFNLGKYCPKTALFDLKKVTFPPIFWLKIGLVNWAWPYYSQIPRQRVPI